jgi:hypothetical protein
MTASNGSTQDYRERMTAFHEPLHRTLTRTFGVVIVAGGVASIWLGGMRLWPALSLVMLWPSLGGHWVDVLFLNGLRPHLPATPVIQRAARLVLWFVAGVVFGLGVRWTAAPLVARPSFAWLTWAKAGLAFVAIELVAHAALQRRGRGSFFNGLG